MSSPNQSSAPESLVSNPTAPSQPTVFGVLAAHARETPLTHLGAAALLGILDAAMIVRASPALWWLAAAFVSLAAYGSWGVADRRLAGSKSAWHFMALRVLRGSAIALGCIAALASVLGLMGSALSGWIL